MKLIIGLGNIGSRYASTRHNVGFLVVEELAKRAEATWKLEAKLKAEIAVYEADGEKIILAKPQTMMNLSGEAAQRIIAFYKLASSDVWAVYDDVDTPFGKLRVRFHGSAGGHQGVRSLIQHTGDGFVRIKIGISLNDRSVEPSEVYVLKPFNPKEQAALPTVIDKSADIIETSLDGGLEETTTDLD